MGRSENAIATPTEGIALRGYANNPNISINFKSYEKIRNDTKNNPTFKFLLDYADDYLKNNSDLIVDKFIPVIGEILQNKNDDIKMITQALGHKKCKFELSRLFRRSKTFS